MSLGQQTPPLFGDFEAQRHFMELAFNLPITQWYRYDPEYWRLDYPPLTAYHSYICGAIANFIDPRWMKLDSSRGFESAELKLFMRSSVVVSDILYIAAVFYYYYNTILPAKGNHKLLMLSVLLTSPALLIVDHGHFQYNSVMLGFTLWAVNFISSNRYVLGSVCFCMALGFKHMALYYSLAFFAYLLGKCVHQKGTASIILLFQLGIAVVVSFTALLLPFYLYGELDDILQIFRRLFPFERGIFEDKVANFWVATSPVLKLKGRVQVETLLRVSAIMTLLACLPSIVCTLYKPTNKGFVLTLGICSLSFFLFSFQVHEKSILLPMLPILLLGEEYLDLIHVFINFAMWSMYPLLAREGNQVGYFSLVTIWNIIFIGFHLQYIKSLVRWIPLVIIASVHIVETLIEPPNRYPHLYVMINMIISAGAFSLIHIYMTMKLLKQTTRTRVKIE